MVSVSLFGKGESAPKEGAEEQHERSNLVARAQFVPKLPVATVLGASAPAPELTILIVASWGIFK